MLALLAKGDSQSLIVGAFVNDKSPSKGAFLQTWVQLSLDAGLQVVGGFLYASEGEAQNPKGGFLDGLAKGLSRGNIVFDKERLEKKITSSVDGKWRLFTVILSESELREVFRQEQ